MDLAQAKGAKIASSAAPRGKRRTGRASAFAAHAGRASTSAARATAAACLIIAFTFIVAIVLAGCSTASTPTSSSTLKVGVRADVAGFGYYNEETKKYYGLEVDIANEMAKRLGYDDVEFTTVTPDTRKQMLVNGQVDCIAACYSTSASREESLDFSPAYYSDYSAIMVENSSMITKLSQLKNLTIGTMIGTNAAPQLVAKLTTDGLTDGNPISANQDNSDVRFDTFHLLQYETYQELSEALEAGRIDAACMDASIAAAYMTDNRSLLDYKVAEQEYGVATKKDAELSSFVARTIQGMLDDGTIDALVDKWD